MEDDEPSADDEEPSEVGDWEDGAGPLLSSVDAAELGPVTCEVAADDGASEDPAGRDEDDAAELTWDTGPEAELEPDDAQPWHAPNPLPSALHVCSPTPPATHAHAIR